MDKLQRAGRDFLLRLIANHGVEGAARACGRWRTSLTAWPVYLWSRSVLAGKSGERARDS